MNYKGFVIRKAFHPGSDFKITENSSVVPRKPKKEDTYWDIIDPMVGPDARWTSEDSLKEAKKVIDDLLGKIGMISNSQKEWDKLRR